VRSLLWDPLVPSLGAPERVFLVPDGAISLVNYAALPQADGRFLVEAEPILHLLTVERDLVPERRSVPRGQGLLALGAPDFDRREAPVEDALLAAAYRGPHASCLDREEIRFAPLPGAAVELARVADRWEAGPTRLARREEAPLRGEAERVLGADATEDALRRLAPGRQVVHLATHGFLFGDSCRAGAAGERGIGGVVAAPARPVVSAPPSGAIEESPYVLSGLALAGANRREESPPGEDDGILTAEEASTLDLAATDWVVLSGCDTGLGRTLSHNEGIEGLRRGFRVAGARCVIMSLWPIADQATVEWMEPLYAARFQDGLDTATAVQTADRWVLAARRARGESVHPFFWAAFVAAGDWR
jgi:CHAT domain-containing protein